MNDPRDREFQFQIRNNVGSAVIRAGAIYSVERRKPGQLGISLRQYMTIYVMDCAGLYASVLRAIADCAAFEEEKEAGNA